MTDSTPKENKKNKKYNNQGEGNIESYSEGKKKETDKSTIEQYPDSSPIIATKYAHSASGLIHSLEKNFYIIIVVVSTLFLLSIFDLSHMNKQLPFSLDTAITIMSAISIAVLVYIVHIVLKFKKVLDSWSDIFERNSIRTGMSIFMTKKSKEEAVIAISETIEEIGEPLRNYILVRGKKFKEFLDVPITTNHHNENKIVFDVLIDSDQVIKEGNDNNDDKKIISSNNNLTQALKEYGSIIIKIIEGSVTEELVMSFTKQIYSYISITKNKYILAIIIGEDATENAYKLAIKLEKKGIIYFVVVEKPTIDLSR